MYFEKIKLVMALLVLLFSLTNSSCKKENSENPNPNDLIRVGNIYQGGIIAYILQEGDLGYDVNVVHGIIAAPYDQSAGIKWQDGSNIATGAIATDIGKGNMNTNIIIANQGSGIYAAKLCADLVLNGYNDWYLPSRNELEKLYSNRLIIGGFNGKFYYWSSSEYFSDYAWCSSFDRMNHTIQLKNSICNVRAIRAF